MKEITLDDKTFRLTMPEAEILGHIQAIARRINEDYRGRRPLFLSVLNGSFMFTSGEEVHYALILANVHKKGLQKVEFTIKKH